MTKYAPDPEFLRTREWPEFGVEIGPMVAGVELPNELDLETAFRAAYFLVEQYLALEKDASSGLQIFWGYLVGDPAVAGDWENSVRRAVVSLNPGVSEQSIDDD